MERLTVDRVAAELRDRGAPADLARQYAEAFVEYQTAAAHIAEHGIILQHPRTGTPMKNPYGEVRDAALERCRHLRGLPVEWLWDDAAPHKALRARAARRG